MLNRVTIYHHCLGAFNLQLVVSHAMLRWHTDDAHLSSCGIKLPKQCCWIFRFLPSQVLVPPNCSPSVQWKLTQTCEGNVILLKPSLVYTCPVRVTKTPSFSTVPPSHRKEDLLVLPKENTATSKHIKATKQQLHRFTRLRHFCGIFQLLWGWKIVNKVSEKNTSGTNQSWCIFECQGCQNHFRPFLLTTHAEAYSCGCQTLHSSPVDQLVHLGLQV